MTETLGKLRTDLGDRSAYDAASQCNRCGYCEQACPTYVVTGDEGKSARGRNQLVRLMLENKLKDPKSVQDALATCLLCGACTTVCYAHVPTADLVLEGRRALRASEPVPVLMKVLGELVERRPRLLAVLLKGANILKRLGVSRLASRTHVLRLLGMAGLEEAERHVEEAPLSFLGERLRRDPELAPSADARWAYFAPCGPNYLYPRVGEATTYVLKKTAGPGTFLDNPCCGLLFYNYGDLEAARRMARRNIENYEERADGLPVWGDCSSCVAHLKTYPQMFLDDAGWRARAEAFAKNVKDAAEMSSSAVPPPAPRAPTSDPRGCTYTYHDSCRARNGEGIVAQPRLLMKTMCGDGYRELPEAGWCCGGAGAFAFTQPELSDEILKRKIANIAKTQAQVVATSSTSCLIQIARGLKKYYSECRVVHVSELLADELRANRYGTPTRP
ncbi:MAG: (Fe-S)-binding protein [Elusimicrobia bacterium]|nr:(Fe-S)-binding protein [Elusimicrobiota bacterium]